MLERRSRARFSFESTQRRWIFDGLFRQKLERYTASQPDVFRAVHQAHAAATEPIQNVVMRNGLARQREPDGFQTPEHGSLHGIASVLIIGKQGLYFPTQLRVPATGFVEQGSAVFRGAFRGAMKQFLDLRPASLG